jgi:hypothetical protein
MAEAQFKQNVHNSFARAKSDMYNLYEHIQFLYREIEELKFKNDLMAQKLSIIRENATQPRKIEYVEKQDSLLSSRNSNKVHKDVCAFAKNIKSINRIRFESEAQALKKGYKKCACLSA